MPSPPQKGETKQAFLGRCIPYMIKNHGKTQSQAAGACYGMWESRHSTNKAASDAVAKKKD